MALDVGGVYGYNASSYAQMYSQKKSEADKTVAKSEREISAESAGTRRTANEELSYLSNKYAGYSFTGANFSPGMTYGSKSTVNVAISPEFLKKMANNPELEKEYEKEIANMKACDEMKVRNIEGQGDRIIAKGWSIDKDGNISSWTIGERGGNRPSIMQVDSVEALRKRMTEKAKAKKAEKKKTDKKKEEKKKAEIDAKKKAEVKKQAEQLVKENSIEEITENDIMKMESDNIDNLEDLLQKEAGGKLEFTDIKGSKIDFKL